jgi:putative flippase GtrA
MSKSFIIKRVVDTIRKGDHFRLFRYLVAGTAISLGYTFTIVALIDWLGFVTAEIANVISLVLWTIISYVIHREFTFRFDGEYGGSVARFIFVFSAKLVASIGCIAIITRYYQSSYLIGVVVNWVVLPLISYVALKLWVFQSAFKTSRAHFVSGLEG